MRCGHRAHHQPAEPAGTGGGRPGRRRGKAPEKGLFLCEGARLCQDAARSGVGVEACFFTLQARERYRAYVEPVLACCREAYEIEDHVAALLSATRHTQGVFCLCRWPQGLAGGSSP